MTKMAKERVQDKEDHFGTWYNNLHSPSLFLKCVLHVHPLTPLLCPCPRVASQHTRHDFVAFLVQLNVQLAVYLFFFYKLPRSSFRCVEVMTTRRLRSTRVQMNPSAP